MPPVSHGKVDGMFVGDRTQLPLRLLLSALILMSIHGQGQAQEIAVAQPEQGATFNEAFDRTAAVSGGVIVGIKLGDFRGNVDVTNIQLASDGKQPFCVRAVTSDGRFSSSNKYVVARAGGNRVRISPVTKAYAGILSNYQARDFAVEAFLANAGKCVSLNAIHIPQIGVAHRTPSVLTVLINGSSRTVTMTEPVSGQPAKCTPVEGTTRIAYDSECVIGVGSLLGKQATFNINLNDGFGDEKQTLTVALPMATEVGSK
jgi:hypothetical protein